MNKRILFIDNGVVNDWSSTLNNYKGADKTLPFVPGEDFLYIGSKYAFNHLYIKMKEVNTNSTQMKIEYYAEGWKEVVEIIDETLGLSQSGFVTFTPDIDTQWQMKQKSNDIAELSSIIIYNQYWLRISFTDTTDLTTKVQWIGNLFSNDDDLYSEFPDLKKADALRAYEPGKTSWEEQAVRAAAMIEQDLTNRGVIDGSENVLERSLFVGASIQKTAEIIFGAFGDDYIDQVAAVRKEYGLRLVRRLPRVDKNNTAVEEPFETRTQTGFMSR